MKRFILVLLLLILISGFVSAEESLGLGAIAEDYAIKALEWLESGAGWVADQVPLYVEEMLRWYLAKNIVLCILYILLTSPAYFISKWGITQHNKIRSGDKKWTGGGYYGGDYLLSLFSLFSLVFIVGVVMHLLNIIQIIIAPRVWLLEYLSSLVS